MKSQSGGPTVTSLDRWFSPTRTNVLASLAAQVLQIPVGVHSGVCQGKSLNASSNWEFNGIRSGVHRGKSLKALSHQEFDGVRSGVGRGKSLNASNREFNESDSEFQDSSTKEEEFWDEEDTSTKPSEDEEDDEMSNKTMSDAAESESRNVDETVTGVELQEWTEEWAEQNEEILMNTELG
jgi:hypothetical protein